MIDFFSRAHRRALPAPALQPDRGHRLHLRRHGEHHRHDADRPGAARRAGGPGPRRRRPGLARAGPPVVGRPAHLPRVARGLAQRGLRHLLRVRLARARQGARRGRRRAAGRRRRLPGRGGPLPAARRVPAVRRAHRPVRRHLYEKGGRVLHMLRHELGDDRLLARRSPLRRTTRPPARSRPATWRRAIEEATGPQPRRASSTSGSASPATPSWRAPGSGTTIAAWAACGSSRSRRASRGLPSSTAWSRFEVEGQRARRRRWRCASAATRFELPLPARPTQVIFDPGDVVLKTIKLEKPRPLWIRQLRGGPAGRRPGAGGPGAGASSPSRRDRSGPWPRRWPRIPSGRCGRRRPGRWGSIRGAEARPR